MVQILRKLYGIHTFKFFSELTKMCTREAWEVANSMWSSLPSTTSNWTNTPTEAVLMIQRTTL